MTTAISRTISGAAMLAGGLDQRQHQGHARPVRSVPLAICVVEGPDNAAAPPQPRGLADALRDVLCLGDAQETPREMRRVVAAAGFRDAAGAMSAGGRLNYTA